MHEFSICQTLVQSVLAELDKAAPEPARLVKVTVVVGALRQIVPEYLQQAYQVLTAGTRAGNSALEVTVAPVKGRCEACGRTTELRKDRFTCEACGAAVGEIVGGKELYLASLEIETPDPSQGEKEP
jgi:hydrogenase nickel incorporation protein HypA/HybF